MFRSLSGVTSDNANTTSFPLDPPLILQSLQPSQIPPNQFPRLHSVSVTVIRDDFAVRLRRVVVYTAAVSALRFAAVGRGRLIENGIVMR